MTDKNAPARQDGQQPIINIVGERVALGPLRRDLLPLYQTWSNDFEVTRFLDHIRPVSFEAEQDWYGRVIKKKDESPFTIYEKPRLRPIRPIGIAGLDEIDDANRNAEFYIMIGDKESWGKGYGTEVARLMLDYGFTCLGLRNINLWANAANERGIRAYRRAGFRVAGQLRQFKRLGGQAYDYILMDCLATEFQGGTLNYLLPEPSEENE